MKDFSITHNRYVGMKKEEVTREQFLPGLTLEDYNSLGEVNAKQLVALYNKYRREPRDVIVEYGCGDARVLKFMESYCREAVGLDISDLVLEAAAKNTSASLCNTSNFNKVDYADFVYSLQVMQHNTYEDQVRILKHIKEMLKPTGLGCVHFPKLDDKPWYVNHDTCMCFTKVQVEEFGKLFSESVIEEVEIMPDWMDYYLLFRR